MDTTAQIIACLFSDDGSCFETEDGRSLAEVCMEQGAHRDVHLDRDAVRHTFFDGSAITVAGDRWDLGYDTCWCWQSVGHVDCDEAARGLREGVMSDEEHNDALAGGMTRDEMTRLVAVLVGETQAELVATRREVYERVLHHLSGANETARAQLAAAGYRFGPDEAD